MCQKCFEGFEHATDFLLLTSLWFIPTLIATIIYMGTVGTSCLVAIVVYSFIASSFQLWYWITFQLCSSTDYQRVYATVYVSNAFPQRVISEPIPNRHLHRIPLFRTIMRSLLYIIGLWTTGLLIQYYTSMQGFVLICFSGYFAAFIIDFVGCVFFGMYSLHVRHQMYLT